MTHEDHTGAREAIRTDEILADYGYIERADLLAAYWAGDRERAREILGTMSRSDDPQARLARHILEEWCDDEPTDRR